jgi:hypothetical protein
LSPTFAALRLAGWRRLASSDSPVLTCRLGSKGGRIKTKLSFAKATESNKKIALFPKAINLEF